MKVTLFTIMCMLLSTTTHASSLDFDDLLGFTLVKLTRVDGDFEGCDYDKTIKMMNGWMLNCSSYHYHYAYSPEVAIFTKDIGRGYLVKMVVDDDIYDMSPILKK